MEQYPGLCTNLVDAGATTLKAMLADGRIDLAVLSEDEMSVSEDADLVWRSLTPPLEIMGYLCGRPGAVLSLANQALLSFFLSHAPLETPLAHKQR